MVEVLGLQPALESASDLSKPGSSGPGSLSGVSILAA
jgi:hypothetical protein